MSDILIAWKKGGLIQIQTKQRRKRRKREGRGNKCKKEGVTVMHKGCISPCPRGTTTLCSWMGAGELSHMASAVREAVRLVCICSWALAWSKRGILRSVMRILERYGFRRLPLGRIWMCCHFWLSSACDVETPLGCCLSPLFPSQCSVWAMVLSGEEEHHLTDGGLLRQYGGLNL